MEMKENVSLKPFTVFQVGGPARFFTETHSKEEVIEALRWAKEKKIPSFILGLGSNILVSDQGFPGLVIKISGGKVSRDGDLITAEAGAKMAEVVNFSLQNGLVGFEWAIGVPGTIGGSVRGNAGCFGEEMKDVVSRVAVLDRFSLLKSVLTNGDCRFGYRDSLFKHNPNFVILSAILELAKGDALESQKKILEYSATRSKKQDIGAKSAGCIFKNVEWARIDREAVTKEFPGLLQFMAHPSIPAAYLIDQAGLKGKKIGKVFVSPKHANYIVNEGGGSADEVMQLIAVIKEYVHRKYNIMLEEEIQLVGF